jgi:ankyrin repeat protein
MKKSIIYLGIAFVSFSTISQASNHQFYNSALNTTSLYEDSTPLCVAIAKRDVEMVKKLLEYGSNVNETSNGLTPLMMASRYNNVEILRILVAKGANSKVKDQNGFTALKYAQVSNANEAIEFLKKL